MRFPYGRQGAKMTGVSMLLLALCACGGGGGGGPATTAAPVTVVPAASTPVPTPTPSPTPSPVSAAPEQTAAPTPSPTSVAPISAGPGPLTVVSEGDSISLMWAGAHTGLYAAAHPSVTYYGNARGGARISDTGGGNGLVQRLPTLVGEKPTVVTLLIGANDLGDGQYPSTQAWLDALWSYVAAVKATGAKVAVGTILPICMPSMPDYDNRHKTRRPVVNAAIRAAVGTKIDAVYDLAADPVMGPDAAACDKTLFKDGLHPTEGADGGQGRIAAIYTRVVDKLLGY
ncbi:SGNH/GDSL hydrolase family protein [Sphingomonas endophytica]|uniref:SGNH/GDSL hydrolase family protein n=1 Tax=Sphingomonas endophytica TaxID=869719 RepID=UPI00187CB61C|nr:SGNH/GDSL hydrolase family protein [Sphingomonas endophytica]